MKGKKKYLIDIYVQFLYHLGYNINHIV